MKLICYFLRFLYKFVKNKVQDTIVYTQFYAWFYTLLIIKKIDIQLIPLSASDKFLWELKLF